ncbi:hypothetical protein HK105_208109 [Polyrhizophydium stewartii]|uniref:Uncharacterized protein n=1 Tax=Polyrhizophydium stewartii TaxID=2732419 RepID=A0ABR4MYZ3_9FUNG|nr:hypothetical protein HK105_003919 [Polyrhizophydium stewartii]
MHSLFRCVFVLLALLASAATLVQSQDDAPVVNNRFVRLAMVGPGDGGTIMEPPWENPKPAGDPASVTPPIPLESLKWILEHTKLDHRFCSGDYRLCQDDHWHDCVQIIRLGRFEIHIDCSNNHDVADSHENSSIGNPVYGRVNLNLGDQIGDFTRTVKVSANIVDQGNSSDKDDAGDDRERHSFFDYQVGHSIQVCFDKVVDHAKPNRKHFIACKLYNDNHGCQNRVNK